MARSLATGQAVDLDEQVVELLLKQIESADLIMVNKADLASDGELRTALAVCAALNSGAQVLTTRFGELPLSSLLPRRPGEIAGEDLQTAGDDGEMTGGVQSSGKQRCTANDHAHDHG